MSGKIWSYFKNYLLIIPGITSYGVSMTTLEEVFLSLEGENDEETESVEGVSSVKLVRARALSRSLSLQSKSLSYQVLQNNLISKLILKC